jgi:BlaI family transcriptional regulator, penicillinase repressor
MRRGKGLRPLGELEERVMAELWGEADMALSVREVSRRLGTRLAYTTVMTTLDRLFKKGLLAREKDGIAFRYRPRIDRDEYHRRVVKHAVSGLLSRSAEPVLAGFLDAAESIDTAHLERLERLIAERRRRRR